MLGGVGLGVVGEGWVDTCDSVMLQSREDGDEVGDGRMGDGGVGDRRSMLAVLDGWFMLEGSGF